MTIMSEDIHSPESELKRTFSTFKNRINLWNFYERVLDRDYRPKSLNEIKVNVKDKDEMVNYIISNNKRIDTIRDYLKRHGTTAQRAKLNIRLQEIE
jgi:hypothetical protein